MSKITEKKQLQNVRMHINKAYDIISEGIPDNYVEMVVEELQVEKTEFMERVIRNVKNRVTEYPSKRLNVLNALVKVAQKYQAQVDELEKLVNQ